MSPNGYCKHCYAELYDWDLEIFKPIYTCPNCGKEIGLHDLKTIEGMLKDIDQIKALLNIKP